MQLKSVKAAVVVLVALTGPIPVRARMTGLPSSVPVQNSLLSGAGERMGSTLSRLVAFMILPISAGKAETMRSRGVAQTPDGVTVAASAPAATPTNSKTVATRT